MQVRWLWLQEEVKKGSVRVFKVKGVENPADLMTKFLSGEEIKKHLGGNEFGSREDRRIKGLRAKAWSMWKGLRAKAVCKRRSVQYPYWMADQLGGGNPNG